MYIILRLWNATGNDLWYDEVFTVLTIRQNWAEMFSTVIRDGVHPPLFYILLKFWSLGSSSVWWLQLFPVSISVLTLIPLYLFCRELKLTHIETAFVFLAIAANGYFLEYALDLRMYGLVQLFTLFSLWAFVRLQQAVKPNHAVWLLAFFNLLLVYTHYFGWLAVGFEGLYLLIWQRKFFLSFAATSATVLVSFAPWFWLVSQNAVSGNATGNLDWLLRPSASDLLWFYTTLNGNVKIKHATILSLVIFISPVIVSLWQAIRQKTQNSSMQVLAFFAFAPVALIFLLSHLLPKSVWEIRYLIIAALPYVVLFVRSAFDLPNKFQRFFFVGVISVCILIAGFYSLFQTPQKIKWGAVAEKVGNASETVYAFEDWVASPLQFYFSEANFPVQVEKRNNLDEIRNKNFWVVSRAPNSDNSNKLQESLREKECRITQESVFSDSWQTVSLFYVEDCR